MNYLLLVAVLLTVFAQNGNSNGGNGGNGGSSNGNSTDSGNSTTSGNSTSSGNSTCDAFTQICPTTPDNCLPSTYGTTVITTPLDQGGVYNYMDRPINFSWTYSGQYDSAYPRKSVYLYYRQVGQTPWTFLTKVGKTTTANGTITQAIPGKYEALIMPDNIDTNNLYGIGDTVSCVPDGWPYPQKVGFLLLQSTQYQVFPDRFPPATSAAIIPKVSLLCLILYMI
ncbi:hypothetical protein HK103_003454 [Boothiomyces macroporosus]|uniref:Uncharacterized protein n=1 Tax=Boothiomyces macroporosus TaxID=261099 RepID=A0AAD5UI05_9FUNG|nr:hypothetical protein HK103_003454 [Boothiomyces macroporosus]